MSVFLSEAGAILDFVARAFLHIVPFLAISIPIAVALRRTGAAEKIRASLSGNPLLAVVLATIVGAVTTLPAMAAVYKLVRPRAFLLYLGFSVAGSLLAGYAYEAVRMLMGR